MLLAAGGALAALLAAAACIAIPASASPGPAGRGAPPVYYLALGDSLSQGVQPATPPLPPASRSASPSRPARATPTTCSPATPRRSTGACGWRSSAAPVRPPPRCSPAPARPCAYPQGSQLAAALAFLRAHHGQTGLITIDIGANDVDGCVTAGAISQACVASGLAAVQHDLPLILGALRHAAGGHVLIAGMNLYDPFLADYLTGAAGQAAATQSVTLGEQLNQLLATADNAFGARTADVAGAFSTTDFTDTATLPGVGTVPLNVARICTWTWMCAPSPVGPNIHANATGYKVIAAAFERVISQFPGLRR